MVKEELVYLGEILERLQKAAETLNYSYGKGQAFEIKDSYDLSKVIISP